MDFLASRLLRVLGLLCHEWSVRWMLSESLEASIRTREFGHSTRSLDDVLLSRLDPRRYSLDHCDVHGFRVCSIVHPAASLSPVQSGSKRHWVPVGRRCSLDRL